MLHPQTNAVGAWYTSQAAEGPAKLVYTGRGVLFRVLIANSNAAARFFWFFDSTTASGTVLLAPVSVAAGGSLDLEFATGLPFNTGLTIGSSSTQATYTGGAGDMLLTAGYIKRPTALT